MLYDSPRTLRGFSLNYANKDFSLVRVISLVGRTEMRCTRENVINITCKSKAIRVNTLSGYRGVGLISRLPSWINEGA